MERDWSKYCFKFTGSDFGEEPSIKTVYAPFIPNMKDKIIQDIKLIINILIDGTSSLIEFLPSLGGNWEKIDKELRSTYSFSKALAWNPFPEFSDEENRLLVDLVHAGEMGGILEITLKRFVKYVEKVQPTFPYSIKGYLATVGLLISCGVPIITALTETPIDKQFEDIKTKAIENVKAGGEITVAFGQQLTGDEYRMMLEAEYDGSLPEYLMQFDTEEVLKH